MNRESYAVRVASHTSVLDALLHIKETRDNSLAIRCSCRMGICGACGIVVNGKPSLACETNALANAKEGTLEISPMEGFPMVKDLVTDMNGLFDKHKEAGPALFRNDKKEKYAAQKEYPQTKEDVDKFFPYSLCIMCGLCLDACPVSNTKPDFLGPQALVQAYRYTRDSRDQMGKERLYLIDRLDGVWGCEFAGSCSDVCPKGVGPASAIQLLKLETMKARFGGEKETPEDAASG